MSGKNTVTALPVCFFVTIVSMFSAGCDSGSDVVSMYESSPATLVVTCGDGILSFPVESCDDGNRESGDGCDSDCAVEAGWDCYGAMTAQAWGDNFYGQLDVPTDTFVAVSAGTYHAVGLKADGSVVGWGRNSDGQADPQPGPFIAVDTGMFYTIGLRPDGSVVGWGSNIAGQVEPHPGPFTAVSCGREFNLGLQPDGSAVGWGDNDQGQCAYHAGPFVAIAAGGYHSLGLRADGSVEGWGENQWGEADSKPGPYIAISAGDHHSIGLKPDGSVEGWGMNRQGQSNPRPGPFIAIDAGGFHNLAMRPDHSVIGWGYGYYGQTTLRTGPFTTMAGGGFFSVAVNSGGCVAVCGDGSVVGTEQCDDLNAESGDGCSADCQVEPYWICESPGQPCRCGGVWIGPSCDRCPDGYWGFPECAPCDCDNGDVCDGQEFCDPVQGCKPGIALICDDGRECSADLCDPVSGCWHDLTFCRCSTDSDCDDGTVCSGIETCDLDRGLCVNGEPLLCTDDDVCDGTSYCDPVEGCLSTPELICDDLRDCSFEYCDSVSGCVRDYSGCECDSNSDCMDDTVCNGTEWCDISPGVCRSGEALFCLDFRECTIDWCDPVTGCVNDASGCECGSDAECDDYSACSGVESCLVSEGLCVAGQAPDCDDGRKCSKDSCDIRLGCVHDLSGCKCETDADCSDHSVCTGIETCDVDYGLCVAGEMLQCRDDRPCTRDSCDPAFGCVHDASHCACLRDEDCTVPHEICLGAENRCAAIDCRPCGGDKDCGPAGNVCRAFESGSYCVVPCGVDACPAGFDCVQDGVAMFCMPVSGDCLCSPDHSVECRDSLLISIDSCGQPGALIQDCGERGCVDSACCPDGTVAVDGSCVAVPESVPEKPDDVIMSEFVEDHGNMTQDAGENDDTAGESSLSGKGCSGGRAGSPIALLIILAVSLSCLSLRGRSRAL